MKLINPLIILRILSTILLIESISFILCIPVALIYKESLDPFLWSALIASFLNILFRILSIRAEKDRISNRDGYLAVALSWLIFTALGTLPYIISGYIPSFIDAFFESSSGFTTTGATIIKDIELLPFSILFWRSLTHWIGGLGIIVLVIIILPSLRITGHQLLSLESSLKEKIHPKTKAIGFRLLFIYLGLTITETIFLGLGEMDVFDSICHSFGTVATGGFSTKNVSIAAFSSYSQYVIMFFMFLSGISYVVYYYLLKLKLSKVYKNEEFWFYSGVTLIAGIIMTMILILHTKSPIEPAFRDGFFQVITIITTTGFITKDYLLWPGEAIALIFLLMFAGASTGSTTGSIKMARHMVVIKNVQNVFTRLVHPKAILQTKINSKPVSDATNLSLVSFVILYLFIFLIGTVLIVLTGLDPVTAASGVASTLGNIGPALGTLGPKFNYSHIPEISLFIFSLLMIIGRLEILTFFALFARSFWKL
ncbi:MAG: TrkH family potassium uptake protein [Bacteroidales bacterium]|jgi:trk system potassium uptake protein TrkH|nr:TrkH family potassium uptake protein [Bacteroidales bacterium]